MPTARRDWICPKCRVSWSIPADAPDPARCPKCPKAEFVPAFVSVPVPSRREVLGGDFYSKYWIAWGAMGSLCLFSLVALLIEGQFVKYAGPDFTIRSDLEFVLLTAPLFGFACSLLLIIYFIPTHIAVYCRHRHLVAVFVANIFIGWTGLGWVLTLIWATMGAKVE